MRFFFVAATLLVLSGFVVGGASAAAANNTTAGDLPNATNVTQQDDGPEIIAHDFERQLDRDITIKSWRYSVNQERFTINLRVHNRTSLSITEALSLEDSGDRQINVFSSYLSPGHHRVNFSAAPGASGEAAAILSTRRSMRQGRAVIISTGYVPNQLPFSQTASTTGWLGGATVLLSMTILAGVQRIRSTKKEPRELT